jgi:hypothetical protein
VGCAVPKSDKGLRDVERCSNMRYRPSIWSLPVSAGPYLSRQTDSPVCKGSTIPLINLTTAIAQVNRVDCLSAGLPSLGSKSAESSEWSRWMKDGQDGEERYTLI